MDTLAAMRVFQAVVDAGGFAAAARALDVSPPVVTRQIAELERDLGARLLQRTTRRVSLTEAGSTYLERVRSILDEVEAARAALQQHTGDVSGTLHVCANPELAAHILAPMIAPFRARHPGVVFDVHVEGEPQSFIDRYDLTLFAAAEGFDAAVVARPFASTVGILCAAPAYLQRHPAPQQPEDLPQHDCLLTRQPDMRSGWLPLAHPQQPACEVAVRSVCLVNHVTTMLEATLAGAGIGIVPIDMVVEHLAHGRLVRVLAPWYTRRYTLYAALASRKFVPAPTRAFVEFLTEFAESRSGQVLGGTLAVYPSMETAP